jgi:hypothetical protein
MRERERETLREKKKNKRDYMDKIGFKGKFLQTPTLVSC